MQLVSTQTKLGSDSFTSVEKRYTKETEYHGKPEYFFRTMFTEMSQLGSDLTVEPFDDFDF